MHKQLHGQGYAEYFKGDDWRCTHSPTGSAPLGYRTPNSVQVPSCGEKAPDGLPDQVWSAPCASLRGKRKGP